MMESTLFIFLFLCHEIEEIMVLPQWIEQNRLQLVKMLPPFLHKALAATKTTFAIVVGWEWCLLLAIVIFLPQSWLFGAVFAYTIHLIIHLGQGFWLRRRALPVPILWSVPCQIPLCFFLLWKMAENHHIFPLFISSLAMSVFVPVNLILAHFLVQKLNKMMLNL